LIFQSLICTKKTVSPGFKFDKTVFIVSKNNFKGLPAFDYLGWPLSPPPVETLPGVLPPLFVPVGLPVGVPGVVVEEEFPPLFPGITATA